MATADACSMPADAGVHAAAPASPGGGGSGPGVIGGLFVAGVGIGLAVEATDSGDKDRPNISPQ